ncbi:ETC complex I subunit conserved region-domain-containing protein [Blastocladiella britannica]|nr:ETC complex I subunit conserved region-domain-containing protein [Blastocladiella britannica]
MMLSRSVRSLATTTPVATTVRRVLLSSSTTGATPAAVTTTTPASSEASSATSSASDVRSIAGTPSNLTLRAVRISRPAKTAMQSGNDNTRFWRLEFDSQDRWTNPLMGWASSADPMQATTLKFRSEEEAVRFAERQGYTFEVVDAPPVKFAPKVYARNYLYSAKKLRYHHTK